MGEARHQAGARRQLSARRRPMPSSWCRKGVDGPKFLVTRNFMAIMDYNQSHSYAVAVGHLADRIRGGASLRRRHGRM